MKAMAAHLIAACIFWNGYSKLDAGRASGD